uniref:MPN domain-containing protein n=1 Tax=Aplanochytrium stocchinoi TaxID=215587 RepID=A0A7S3LKV0_9STRA|mmetsp:Transcript_17859/g.22008  ORF Transcript_17859/g.22008 Transcript_17859/m.22008 type:complete len:276 (+) Transcript_17859:302-1129(+)|eukprot:CAMPEP_0204836788 /NCGR_PEP_ID=MMETSP1346-20131115/26174_1 /ASSEMBLY_ACC=CAM_ASM_000771 /TAXON_ID=215587 /ORGANISM="Aplanochytrium stocchinoi, Strain GSBS06" /LENGTH=275 /DNA_ID=CAMNT_0051971785 /DNA_START=196 /DNA_END=1023 /DNA_ORIENTATION=+
MGYTQAQIELTLSKVYLSKDILEAALLHALSNEQEEVAGLLLGKWVPLDTSTSSSKAEASTKFVAIVYKICALPRADRKKDRVEVSDQDLVKVQQQHQGTGINVIGWFHSHPHITIKPSHVDLKTQGRFQQLDSRFFGIIISCFNETSIEKIAFQSSRTSDLIDIPIIIDDKQHLRKFHNNNVNDTRDEDGNQHSRMDILNVLFEEERDRYKKYLQNSGSNHSHCNRMYIHFTYQQALAKLMEYSLDPNIRLLQDKLVDKTVQLQMLEKALLQLK